MLCLDPAGNTPPAPMTTHLPDDLIPGHSSSVFTRDTRPDALRAEHTLAPGHWAVLIVLEGGLRFVSLETGEEQSITAPAKVIIRPGRRTRSPWKARSAAVSTSSGNRPLRASLTGQPKLPVNRGSHSGNRRVDILGRHPPD